MTTTPREDEADAAMGRYAEGDDRAFQDVYRCVAERLRAFLLRQTRKPSVADDLLQETLLRMHRARGSFERGARVLPWCYAIARNVHIDYVRQGAVRKERPASDEEEGGALAESNDADGEQIVAARELADIVDRTLAALPPNQREAFILLRYEGLSVADAAAVLGATEGAVKLRAFHAYEALREALGPEGPKKRGRK
ncbi:MAG TPA: RNA polymerase sigma factor [Polyangiaceae bacterium]|jgi:RNA polymerase sigma-70 factor (ECF subfamily)|nr:RNA polymerase sigma factor [Polyangiaceae bacterium]